MRIFPVSSNGDIVRACVYSPACNVVGFKARSDVNGRREVSWFASVEHVRLCQGQFLLFLGLLGFLGPPDSHGIVSMQEVRIGTVEAVRLFIDSCGGWVLIGLCAHLLQHPFQPQRLLRGGVSSLVSQGAHENTQDKHIRVGGGGEGEVCVCGG